MTTLLQFSIVYSLMVFSFSLVLTLQIFVLMKKFYIFVFRRHLQDVLNKTNIFTLVIPLQKASSRRHEDVLKASSRRLQKTLFAKRLQDIFKTSWRRFEDVLKASSWRLGQTSSRRPGKMSSRHLQDLFKTYHQLNIKHLFETYCEDDYLLKDLPGSHFWEIPGQLTNCSRMNSLDIRNL